MTEEQKESGRIPHCACYCWATEKNYTYWRYIVKISGEAPFLRVAIIHDLLNTNSLPKTIKETGIKSLVYGPIIEFPKMPSHLVTRRKI